MNLPLFKSTITSVKRQLQEARDFKASCEVKAFLPPANCSQPELYAQEMQPHIDHAQMVIDSFEAKLAGLERTLREEEAKPVQLSLLAC